MSDRLTLVVFKDHLSSRTLTVRLSWLRGFALALLSVIGLAIIAGALFLNAYRKTIASGPLGTSLKAEEVEKELAETKSAYESLKQQALNSASGGSTSLAGSMNTFTALPPDSILESIPAPETLPFRLEKLTAQWKGNTLQIRSAIEYAREDGGNQQGHFVIIARGPQALLAYPEGVFGPAGTPVLVKPDSGEYFSVSRYREIKADFGPFARHDDVQSIEIFIFDQRKRLIYLNRLGLETSPTKAAPAPAPVPTPAPSPAPKKTEAAKAIMKPESVRENPVETVAPMPTATEEGSTE